ncbi:hypothetical protein MA16_Dca029030 [Dendrobium catenatum]|uniref:Uncharacterized protein n=1 Tax=Dendrobium catenatum TaxID=906689 RepID=A0A2I0VG79_9ASPA|nr:hypothetical protein MA16_Dca029030 [Dendrobium catenatum]
MQPRFRLSSNQSLVFAPMFQNGIQRLETGILIAMASPKNSVGQRSTFTVHLDSLFQLSNLQALVPHMGLVEVFCRVRATHQIPTLP